ncbi:hypothetical protein AK830_g2823 [Neonectria ditissima]|uniref:Protein kinase domain-containing protein n=1 Tax=Neonectria ditissima TaxID=78410 RepID=A0A0N8H866_9HYPO|nr:hypothetical protein AK830_g2823 [Neonectria ditissima]
MDSAEVQRLQQLLAESNQLLEEANQRADREQQRTQPTTLSEYIANYHTSVFSRFAIQINPDLLSKGTITVPQNKWCPTNLQPWTGFLDEQRAIFGTVYHLFPTERRVFTSRHFLATLGGEMSDRPIGDERALEHFLHISVEDPVRNIIKQFKEVPDLCDAFNLGNGITFENHPHAISDVAEEVVDRKTPCPPPQTPGQLPDLNQLRADQICIYRSDDPGLRTRTMVYISEYKPPHKLTAPHLRRGLRPMNLYQEVVNRMTVPTKDDREAYSQYLAEKYTASALTQTYHYMLQGGLEYSLLTTGEAIVFLKIDWEDTKTLYYHLAEPGPEVSAHPANMHICTAVGQYLAFTLLALGQRGARQEHGQAERDRAMQNSKTWAMDFETMLRSTSKSDRTTSSEGSLAPPPTTYETIDRSPLINRLRKRSPRKRTPRCNNDQQQIDGQPEPSDDESPTEAPDTPTPTARRSTRDVGGAVTSKSSARDAGARDGAQDAGARDGAQGAGARDGAQDAGARDASAGEGYCTQKCLLGLVRGKDLDPRCPNFELHRCVAGQTRHPVTHTTWLVMLQEQLRKSLDDGITRLQSGGARGVLFKVTLLAYGYTFVSKGTVRAFIKDLEHEATVYSHLFPIQGINVPVFLGAVDLRPMNKVYYYDHRVYVVHMTFMSWGGCSLAQAEANGKERLLLRDSAMRSVRALHRHLVLHNDARAPNMLFNAEVDGVMVIDFERSTLLAPPRAALLPVVSNKRTRILATGDKDARKRSRRFAEEELTAEQDFMVL